MMNVFLIINCFSYFQSHSRPMNLRTLRRNALRLYEGMRRNALRLYEGMRLNALRLYEGIPVSFSISILDKPDN